MCTTPCWHLSQAPSHAYSEHTRAQVKNTAMGQTASTQVKHRHEQHRQGTRKWLVSAEYTSAQLVNECRSSNSSVIIDPHRRLLLTTQQPLSLFAPWGSTHQCAESDAVLTRTMRREEEALVSYSKLKMSNDTYTHVMSPTIASCVPLPLPARRHQCRSALPMGGVLGQRLGTSACVGQQRDKHRHGKRMQRGCEASIKQPNVVFSKAQGPRQTVIP